VRDPKNGIAVNESRFHIIPNPKQEMRPHWWSNLVGKPTDMMPERSIRDLGIDSVPSRMVFYSYFFRPNYLVREKVAKRVREFNWCNGDDEVCATMHVRRGDVIFHSGAARFYITLETYVRSALPYIKALGVNTILLLTDSQAVIDEALACEKDFPDICHDIKWKYVEKKRWIGAEGGWENPFPSGSAITEFIHSQVEFTLAQKSDLMIMGDSGYGDLVYSHMCCGYPLHDRGEIPHRCICPPRVRVEQGGFTCKEGNKIICDENYGSRGGDITIPLDDPRNTKGAEFSKTNSVFHKKGVKVWLTSAEQYMEQSYMLDQVNDEKVSMFIAKSAMRARNEVCKKFDHGPTRRVQC
jgi:hypothetical protein